MHFSDDSLEHAFDPLKVVDIKALASIAKDLKNSKDKKKKAVGVFLDRINRVRSDDHSSQDVRRSNSNLSKTSGLKDLQD